MRRIISILLLLVLFFNITSVSRAGDIDDIPHMQTADDATNEPENDSPDDLSPNDSAHSDGEYQNEYNTDSENSQEKTPEEILIQQDDLQAIKPTDYRQGDGTYEEDRVLVQFKSPANTGITTFSSDNTDLGVAYSEIRLLTSIETEDNSTYIRPMITGFKEGLYLLVLEDFGVQAVENALQVLSENPLVEFAQPDYIYEYQKAPNDPLYSEQYAHKLINSERAWDFTTGSKSVVVGVMDTGIDGRHIDLADNIWSRNGRDFISNTTGTPTDPSGHGTQVAGIIGAKGNNKQGVSGICWDVSLAWLGVGYNDTYTNTTALVTALTYATDNKIPILNNSYGNYVYDQALKNAIDKYPGLFVAAAGNFSTSNVARPFYPASYNSPRIISVASVNSSSTLSGFSNHGSNVHIAAPGQSVYTTQEGNKYKLETGTSFASPYVAGTAALMLSINPQLSAQELKSILITTSRKVSSLNSYGGFGILDAAAAVELASTYGTGWREKNGSWYYYEKNVMQKNRWILSNNKWYYLKSNGVMATGWLDWNGKRFYMGNGTTTGGMQSGWFKVNNNGILTTSGNNWYYHQNSGGIIRNSWRQINGSWFYFNSDGKMRTGWLDIGKQSWYLGNGVSTGGMRNGWFQTNSAGRVVSNRTDPWYYHQTGGGVVKNGWRQINGNWYYFNNDGTMRTGWLDVGKRSWYLGNGVNTGAMRNGWFQVDSTTNRVVLNSSTAPWYYQQESGGIIKNGWLHWNNNWYFFKSDGTMATGKGVATPGGIRNFTSRGVWIP